MFQKSIVDPQLQTYKQQVVPGIQQAFGDLDAGSSSALNQALAQSAKDLSTSMGAQYGNFFQNQQNAQLQALQQFLPFLTQQTYTPVVQQKQGIAGPVIQGLGQGVGAAIAASSREIKENIEPYKKGLETLETLEVVNYDYKSHIAQLTNRVGLIAEDVPEEFRIMKGDIPLVDVYGLVGLLIKSVQELSNKVKELEGELTCQVQ